MEIIKILVSKVCLGGVISAVLRPNASVFVFQKLRNLCVWVSRVRGVRLSNVISQKENLKLDFLSPKMFKIRCWFPEVCGSHPVGNFAIKRTF